MINIKRWWPLTLGGAAFALALAIALAFAVTYRARAEAARYLRLVIPLRIGTSYDVAAAQLRNANLPMRAASGDCHLDCSLSFLVGDKWLYKLHLAPPVGFSGRLDFRKGTLVYKSTSLGQDPMVWSATVSEGSPGFGSLVPGLHGTQDSSGNVRHLSVHLSPSDFTEYRNRSYTFNLACIGSIKPCRADEYLPTNDLRRLSPQVAH